MTEYQKMCESSFEIMEIPIEEIVVYSLAMDREDTGNIESLANSIADNGMHTEVWCRKHVSGAYELFSGQRRYLAHRHLKRETIRAKIFNEIKDKDIPYMRWVENDQRKDLDMVEKILYVVQLINIELKYQGFDNQLIKNTSVQASLLASTLCHHRIQLSKNNTIAQNAQKIISATQTVLNKTGAFKNLRALEIAIPLTSLPTNAIKMLNDGRLAFRAAKELATLLKKMSEENKEQFVDELATITEIITIPLLIELSKKYLKADFTDQDIHEKLSLVMEKNVKLNKRDQGRVLALIKKIEEIIEKKKQRSK